MRWFAAALAAALLLPLLVVGVPPVLDYPNHLARLFVLAHPADPILSRFYAPHWTVLPNLGFDVIGLLLLKILPVHVGGRILLGMSLLAPPLGVMAYSRAAFGRVTGWSLASALAAFNGAFFLGFMNFLLGLGLAFAAAGLWLILRRRSGKKAAIAGALASVLLFFCHIFAVALFGLLIASAEAERLLTMRKVLTGREVLRRLVLLALTLAPALVLYAISPLSNNAAGVGEWLGWHKVWEAFTPFMSPSKNVTLLTGVCVFGFVILHLRGARFAPGARTALAVLALLFLISPDALKGGTFLDVRLALMCGLLLFAGVAPAARSLRYWALLFAILVALRSGVVALSWSAHARDLVQLRTVIADVPPGAKVLAAEGEAPERLMLPGLYRLDGHMPALLLIERHAFWPLLFADPTQQPVIVKPPYDRLAQPVGGETVDWSLLFEMPSPQDLIDSPYLKNWRANFDYVLLIEPPESRALPPGLVPVHGGPFAALYRVSR